MKKVPPLGLLALSLLLIAVHASSINVTEKPLTSEVGFFHNWTNGVSLRDRGDNIASSNQTATSTGGCGVAVQMSQSGGTTNTTIVAGNYVHLVNVTLDDPGLVNTCFSVTTIFNGVSQTLYITTSGSPIVGDFVLCRFDLGRGSPSGAYLLEVTVQPAL